MHFLIIKKHDGMYYCICKPGSGHSLEEALLQGFFTRGCFKVQEKGFSQEVTKVQEKGFSQEVTHGATACLLIQNNKVVSFHSEHEGKKCPF